jgi:DEAD/DEAH box helicase domain-containing protein
MLVFDGGTRTGSLFSAASEEEKAQIIAGLGSLYRQMAPFFLLCDSRDIGVSERLKEPHFDAPALFFFDQYPGGTGLAEKFLDSLDLSQGASHLLRSCPLRSAAPVHRTARQDGGDRPRIEEGALAFLDCVVNGHRELCFLRYRLAAIKKDRAGTRSTRAADGTAYQRKRRPRRGLGFDG